MTDTLVANARGKWSSAPNVPLASERGAPLPLLLEAFGIPVARFNERGSLEHLAESARDLFGAGIEELLQEAEVLVRRLLALGIPLKRSEPSVLVLPSHDGTTTLRAQACNWEGREGVVVLFLPARRTDATSLTAWGLSARERQVAHLVSTGATAKEIAARLTISVHTVRRHTERVFTKLGVQSRSQVVLLLRGSRRSPDAN